MNKALCISATIALALSGTAFAGGGKHSQRGASTSADTSAQFSMSDCAQLSVASARSQCERSASASTHMNVGATAGSGGGSSTGGDRATGSPTGNKQLSQ